MFKTVFVFVVVKLFSTTLADEIACRDDNGNLVDWYHAYKLPRNRTHPNHNIANGLAYVYILSAQPELDDWTLSPLGIDNNQSMMARTLSPIYAQSISSDLAYVLYNDEDPDGQTSVTKGHSKGVLVVNQNKGFWIMQSVPKYPSLLNATYGYPATGHTYGQDFLCISISTEQADKIGIQFQYSIPNIYNYSMPSWTRERLPNLFEAVVNSKEVTQEPWYKIVDIQSAGAVAFTAFAKHTKYGKDVYGDLVAPTLHSDLDVETWTHGKDTIPSICSSYTVLNVDSVYLSPLNYTFNSTLDHSKWAVSPGNAVQQWICLGDNNRMKSQKARAGITLCRQSAQVWSVYSKSVVKVQPCPSP